MIKYRVLYLSDEKADHWITHNEFAEAVDANISAIGVYASKNTKVKVLAIYNEKHYGFLWHSDDGLPDIPKSYKKKK